MNLLGPNNSKSVHTVQKLLGPKCVGFEVLTITKTGNWRARQGLSHNCTRGFRFIFEPRFCSTANRRGLGERGEAMDEESVRKFVAAYLKKKGFKQTENAFQEELNKNTNNSSSPISFNSQFDPDVAKHILSFSEYSLSCFFFLGSKVICNTCGV